MRVDKQHHQVADHFVVVGFDWTHNEDTLAHAIATDNNSAAPLSEPLTSQNGSETLRDWTQVEWVASVLDHYPPSSAQHFPEGVEFFCFPDGLRFTRRAERESFHAFVHTSEDGSRSVGCVLAFSEELTDEDYERLGVNAEARALWRECDSDVRDSESEPTPPSQHRLFVRKGICILSHFAYITNFKLFLRKLYVLSHNQCLPMELLSRRTTTPRELFQSVPIERFVCNLIDDVPAPPPGLINVVHVLDANTSLSFSCPPLNAPHDWNGFSLCALFEALSAPSILSVLSLLLTERQVLFVSSSYCLLTLSAEAITSLCYPLHWAHAYIPVLPTALLGALQAPFPFIFGVHSDAFARNRALVTSETACVFLDEDRVDFGELGRPVALPEKRAQKLIAQIYAFAPWNNPANTRNRLNRDEWRRDRLPLFDDAMEDATDMPLSQSPVPQSPSHNGFTQHRVPEDELARDAFLKFFVAILKDYRRFVVYDTDSKSTIQSKFNTDDFVKSQLTEWQPFLSELTRTQSFSNFLDERTTYQRLSLSTVFFDECIDAKYNRYMFRTQTLDTPFLYLNYGSHTRTYVTPPPHTADLDMSHGSVCFYKRFPKLNPSLFVPQRHLAAHFTQSPDRLLSVVSKVRLKRRFSSSLTGHAVAPTHTPTNTLTPPPSHTSSYTQLLTQTLSPTPTQPSTLSAAACVFSSYLVTLSLLISQTLQDLSVRHARLRRNSLSLGSHAHVLSTSKILAEYTPSLPLSVDAAAVRGRSGSLATSVLSAHSVTRHEVDKESNERVRESFESECATIVTSARLALQVCFEVLNALTRLDYAPDEVVYRCLAETCADLRDPLSLTDLIVHLDDEGLIPDHQIRHSLLRASSSDPDWCVQPARPVETQSSVSVWTLSPEEVWSFSQWRTLKREKSSLVLRSSVAVQSGGSPRAVESESTLSRMLFGSPATPLSPTPHNALSQQSPQSQSLSLSHNAEDELDRWSANDLEGYIPQLNWSFLGAIPEAAKRECSERDRESERERLRERASVCVCSRRLARQSALAERLLSARWARLVVALSAVRGTACPAPRCASHAMAVSLSRSGTRVVSLSQTQTLTQSVPLSLSRSHSVHSATAANRETDREGERERARSAHGEKVSLSVSLSQRDRDRERDKEREGAPRRALSLGELLRGWRVTDTNTYTAQCPHCGTSFVPRFAVLAVPWPAGEREKESESWRDREKESEKKREIQSAVTQEEREDTRTEREKQRGIERQSERERETQKETESEFERDAQWLELLSPWTLHKETLTLLFDGGAHALLRSLGDSERERDRERDKDKDAPHNSSRAAIFWNLLVAWRLRGLPFAFLLTNGSLAEAFPPLPGKK